MSMLAGSLKKPGTVIYSSIIILSSNITLAFAINNFSFEDNLNHDYLKSLFSVFVVLMVAFLLALVYQAAEKNITAKYSETVGALLEAYAEDKTPTTLIQPAADGETVSAAALTDSTEDDTATEEDIEIKDVQVSRGTRTSYEVLCDLENDLIMKMKTHSQTLYDHALHIGDLSYRAAMEIGADEMLALAGGLYHEVGKINGKNYIEEGLIIAEDYAFPKELKAILKEHNIKFEKPGSVEAAIVMLSDSVVSTIEYIEKTDEHKYTTGKVIDNIFQLRMDKGTFDSANFSLKDYKKLKEFYQKEFSK
jgi:putative nucleotidyltransferase with HDIG domain